MKFFNQTDFISLSAYFFVCICNLNFFFVVFRETYMYAFSMHITSSNIDWAQRQKLCTHKADFSDHSGD